MMCAFLTVLSVDIDIRYGLHPKIKKELSSKKEERLLLPSREGKKSPSEAQWMERPWCRTGQAAVWTLCRPLCCGSMHLAGRGTQKRNSISAVEWEAREQRGMTQSLRKMTVEQAGTRQNNYYSWWRLRWEDRQIRQGKKCFFPPQRQHFDCKFSTQNQLLSMKCEQ